MGWGGQVMGRLTTPVVRPCRSSQCQSRAPWTAVLLTNSRSRLLVQPALKREYAMPAGREAGLEAGPSRRRERGDRGTQTRRAALCSKRGRRLGSHPCSTIGTKRSNVAPSRPMTRSTRLWVLVQSWSSPSQCSIALMLSCSSGSKARNSQRAMTNADPGRSRRPLGSPPARPAVPPGTEKRAPGTRATAGCRSERSVRRCRSSARSWPSWAQAVRQRKCFHMAVVPTTKKIASAARIA